MSSAAVIQKMLYGQKQAKHYMLKLQTTSMPHKLHHSHTKVPTAGTWQSVYEGQGKLSHLSNSAAVHITRSAGVLRE